MVAHQMNQPYPVQGKERRQILIIEPVRFTEKQILGLIPAQAILDYDRAKEVLEMVADQTQRNVLKQVVLLLATHYFGSLPDGRDTFAFTQQELTEIRG